MKIEAMKDIHGPITIKKGETRNVRDGIANDLIASGRAKAVKGGPGPAGEKAKDTKGKPDSELR